MKSEAIALPLVRSRTSDFVTLAKPRLNFLVVVTASVAFYLGAGDRLDLVTWACTVAGTALVAGSAAALNQIYERDVDGLMHRTRLRPLPDGRVQPGEALTFALAIGGAGLGILAAGANVLAALVAFATVATYIGIYTPMKRRTPFSTVLGAIPGALPPVIGWTAARGDLSLPAWALFAIVFFWQIPHFLAIAWIYRDEYERAGFPMLSVIEPDGRSMARHIVFFGGALVPVSVGPAILGLAGSIYAAGAVLLGLGFLGLGLRFATARTIPNARGLFLGSIMYLPALWVLMLVNRASG